MEPSVGTGNHFSVRNENEPIRALFSRPDGVRLVMYLSATCGQNFQWVDSGAGVLEFVHLDPFDDLSEDLCGGVLLIDPGKIIPGIGNLYDIVFLSVHRHDFYIKIGRKSDINVSIGQ